MASPTRIEAKGDVAHKFVTWTEEPTGEDRLYRLELLMTEEDGAVLIEAAQLPGAISQGATPEDAIENIREALSGLIREYRASKQEIPWQAPKEPRPGQVRRWVLVRA